MKQICFSQTCNKQCHKTCGGCRIAYYCCPEHQAEQWSFHREICMLLAVTKTCPICTKITCLINKASAKDPHLKKYSVIHWMASSPTSQDPIFPENITSNIIPILVRHKSDNINEDIVITMRKEGTLYFYPTSFGGKASEWPRSKKTGQVNKLSTSFTEFLLRSDHQLNYRRCCCNSAVEEEEREEHDRMVLACKNCGEITCRKCAAKDIIESVSGNMKKLNDRIVKERGWISYLCRSCNAINFSHPSAWIGRNTVSDVGHLTNVIAQLAA